jgi:hypothetical protein
LGTKLALSLIILALIGLVEGTSTLSAFSAITQNPGNTFSTGSVDLEDDDSGSAMLTLTAAKPGDTDEGCIRVRYPERCLPQSSSMAAPRTPTRPSWAII